MKKIKVSVIGLGYVGFPLLCAIARNKDYDANGFDLSLSKIELIRQKKSPIDDKQAMQDIKEVDLQVDINDKILDQSDVFIIAVPTPVTDDYEPDLSFVNKAAETVAKYLVKDKNQIIVLESTVNPGVCEEDVLPILEKVSGLKGREDFELVHCPERINPGDSKWNVYNIPRNIGALTVHGCQRAADFYRSFIKAEIYELSNIKEAESTKIIENTFRDINIAYVNELAKSFDVMGINLKNVIRGASNKPFAFMPHYPGCGVGGHCIAVDPYYLIKRAKNAGFDHKFLKLAREINNSMPAYAVELLEKELAKINLNLANISVGLLGLAYKKNIADIRESPALEIKNILSSRKIKLETYDPFVLEQSTCKSLEEIIGKVDALIVATNHDLFLELNEMKNTDNIKVIIDGRNFLNKDYFINTNIIYKGIGC